MATTSITLMRKASTRAERVGKDVGQDACAVITVYQLPVAAIFWICAESKIMK